jgi:glycosyltransferase involved in cell wall biosynthesis
MRFCVVLGHYPKDTPGGAEFQAYLITRELARRGHDTHYVAYKARRAETAVDEGITVHRLNSEVTPPETPETVLNEIDDIDPEYVYFRNFPDLHIADQLDNRFDGDIIFNISHDRQCMRLRNNWRKMVSPSSIYKWINDPWYLFKKRLLQSPDYRFAQTKYQQDSLRKNYDLSSSYVGNGHPVPKDTVETRDPPIVLWLASLKSWKQPLKFVEVAEECRDIDCRFWLVGRPANPELADDVIEHIDRLPNISYKGGCNIEESNRYIEQSSLFVNTSKKEGFPNTFIQSWLRETPVVSLHVDPDGVLNANQIGMCAEGDFDQMTEAIRSFVLDSKWRNKVGERAGEYGRSNHDITVVVNKLLDVIE